jgi:hypothetical protein
MKEYYNPKQHFYTHMTSQACWSSWMASYEEAIHFSKKVRTKIFSLPRNTSTEPVNSGLSCCGLNLKMFSFSMA